MLFDGKDCIFPPPLFLSHWSALNTVADPPRMHSAEFNVSVFPVSLSRALLLGEVKEKPIAHVTGIVRHSTKAEMFLTLEYYNLLVFVCWHIYLLWPLLWLPYCVLN